jgi:hypothetical protein
MPDRREDHAARTDRIAAACADDPRITGRVLFGSTADTTRIDEWSDHDFAVIAAPEHVEALRADLAFLRDGDRPLAVVREHHNGFKAVTTDGRPMEFAVTDLDGLLGFEANDWAVRIGDEALRSRMHGVAIKPRRPVDITGAATAVIVAILIGVGRFRRGERVSASTMVRGFAAEHLASLIGACLRPVDDRRDDLDPHRRIELGHPVAGRRLADLLDEPLEDCARGMLELLHDELAPSIPGFPFAALEAVRARIG